MRIEWPYNEIEKQIEISKAGALAEGDYFTADRFDDVLKIIEDLRKHYNDHEEKEAQCQLTSN